MQLDIYQIDAFASVLFKGNPAAVCPLDDWISDEMMQNIALENNLSETAFFVKQADGIYRIRYFTPSVEIDLCGHATLASAHLIFNILNLEKEQIVFKANKDELKIFNNEGRVVMDFPSNSPMKTEVLPEFEKALRKMPIEAYCNESTYLLLFEDENDIASLNPDFNKFFDLDKDIVIVTSKGNDCDFVSRVFGPKVGINEDPVTGYAHTLLIPFWSKRLNRNTMFARQISKRGGELFVENLMDRVIISGEACLYLKGEIYV